MAFTPFRFLEGYIPQSKKNNKGFPDGLLGALFRNSQDMLTSAFLCMSQKDGNESVSKLDILYISSSREIQPLFRSHSLEFT